jgi:hypothetical protein
MSITEPYMLSKLYHKDSTHLEYLVNLLANFTNKIDKRPNQK